MPETCTPDSESQSGAAARVASRRFRALGLVLLSPFGIALFPVVHLAGSNINQITPLQIVQGVLVVSLVTALILTALRWSTKSLEFSAVATSFAAIVFFAYGRLYETLTKLTRGSPLLGDRDVLHITLIIASLFVLGILCLGCWRIRGQLRPLHIGLGVAAAVALAPSIT